MLCPLDRFLSANRKKVKEPPRLAGFQKNTNVFQTQCGKVYTAGYSESKVKIEKTVQKFQ